jgi:hypothetical protein
VRSAEIMGLLPAYFEVAEVRPLGGALLHFLLDDIAGNFDPDKPQDLALLNMLFALEDALMDAGELSSDFATAALRKA